MPTQLPDLTPEQQAKIDRVVAEINSTISREALTVALGTGKLVIDNFYEGKVAGWQERGTKDTSFRALAARRDLEMTPTRLYYSVGIFQMSVELGGLEQFAPPLTYTHLRNVIGHPVEEQRRLLTLAKDQGWTVARLLEEIDGLAEKAGKDPQPRALTEVRRAFRQLREILDETEGLLADLRRAGIDPTASESLGRVLELLRVELVALNPRLPAKARFADAA